LGILVNATDKEKGLARHISVKSLVDLVLRGIELVTSNSIESDIIIELAFKILINLINSDPDIFENHRDGIVLQIFKIIQFFYKDFQIIAQQYVIRFIYHLSKTWTPEKLEHNMQDLVPIIELFILYCVTLSDMKLILLTIDRMSSS
jgi:hypothetical protein